MNEQVREFVRLFNVERDFYECHEWLESAWKAEAEEPLKSFYKALVQVATAQFKINQGLLNGFRKLYGYCFKTLAALPDVYQGIDIKKLRQDFTAQLQQLPEQSVIAKGSYPQYGLEYLTLRTVEEPQ